MRKNEQSNRPRITNKLQKKGKRVPAEESRKRKETSHTADVYGESAEEKTQSEENFTKNIAQKNKKKRDNGEAGKEKEPCM